jgi:cobalamin biosynthesis protein CobT
MNDAGADADAPEWVSAEVLSTAANGPMAKQLADPGGHQRSMEASKNVQSAMAATSTQLNRALKSAAKDRWKGGRMDGRLDRSRLANVRMGSSDVYRRKVKGDVIDTAVEILVDCSGSMNGEEIQICQQLALILESAFSGTKIKHEIIGFTTADIGDADPAFQTMTAAHQKRGSTLQARAIGLYEFRKYGQPHSSALQTIGNMTEVGMGSTPTSDAILLAHDRLARRPERRHVMFVLTDGDADDNEECKKAVKAVEKCGVTVIGIGIGTGTVKKSFTNHAVLKTATDLPALMMSQISSMLIGDKNKVGLKGLAAAQARKL